MQTYKDPYSDPSLYAPVRKSRAKAYIAVGLVLLIAFIVTGLLIIVNLSVQAIANPEDTGIKACQTVATNANSGHKSDSSTMTEESFQTAKQPWQNSRYSDLKVAGTSVITTIYQMTKDANGDATLAVELVDLSTLRTQWASLQTACSNHGVAIPALPLSS
jgi:anthranilate/para-aminobenzoate synthase component II